jgi:signal recognition particle receptor subunit beta
MPTPNYAKREIVFKIVYVGPGLGGKTTNLERIYEKVPADKRGELLNLKTATERTLAFDLLHLDVGTVNGFSVGLRLHTVPGQVFYRHTQAAILKNVDGIVFVADSDPARLEASEVSMYDLFDLMRDQDAPITPEFPLLIQYNKRDLPGASSIATLDAALNPWGFPTAESVARDGVGVMETLRQMAQMAMSTVAKV